MRIIFITDVNNILDIYGVQSNIFKAIGIFVDMFINNFFCIFCRPSVGCRPGAMHPLHPRHGPALHTGYGQVLVIVRLGRGGVKKKRTINTSPRPAILNRGPRKVCRRAAKIL